MKKFLTYSLSLLLAMWMLPVSAGLNIAHHCCHCRHTGTLHVAEEQCQAGVHHETHLHEACSCGQSCSLQHLALQDTTLDSEHDTNSPQPTQINLFYSCFSPELHFPLHERGELQPMEDFSPDGRSLLSLHTALLL